MHLDVDVQDIGCDFYVFTGHKLYGPTGIGVLYGKYEHLAAMPPFNGGGEMIREVFEDRITYGEPPHRFEAGTPSIVQAIGLGAAIDYVGSIGKARIRAHEREIVAYAHDRLRETIPTFTCAERDPARPHRPVLRPSNSIAASTICSGSKPNLRCSSLSGAEAPKVFMPMTRPSAPT